MVLNWNQPDFTIGCLESLGFLHYQAHETVVVDNGSVDDSPNLIRQRFPHVTVVENGRNLGFAAGNNVGIDLLLSRGVEYVMLLNNDTVVGTDLLCRLVEVAESDPMIGILGPKIYYYDLPDVIWSAGGVVSDHGEPRHLRAEERDEGMVENIQDIDYATGCAILVKTEVIRSIGVLDERFFIYFEETEWCARARAAGFRVVYVPGAHMWHKIKPGARDHSRRYLYLMTRNRLLYLRCLGAPPGAIVRASLEAIRTVASWNVHPRHREKRRYTGAVLAGIGHFIVGRFGAPPASL